MTSCEENYTLVRYIFEIFYTCIYYYASEDNNEDHDFCDTGY